MILDLLFVTYIRIFFGHCHVTIPLRWFLPLSVIVTWHFHICRSFPYQVIVFVIQKFVVFRFILSLLIAKFRWQPLCYEQSPAFTQKFQKKSLFISATTFEKYIVCKHYCIAHHDDKTCFLPACKYHIILHGNVEELLKKLDTFSFTYQHVDCLYTLFKYRFSGKVIAKSGQVFDNVQRAVDFNHRNKGVDRMPSIAKKRLLRRKFKKPLSSSFQKTKTTQTSGSVFAQRIEKVKKTEFGLDLIKLVDCFLDGHGSYDSILVSFKIKSL